MDYMLSVLRGDRGADAQTELNFVWVLFRCTPTISFIFHPLTMSVNHKVLRTANAPSGPPSELETKVAQALIELESNVPELKAELRLLQISAAKEIDVKGGKKAIVIFVPVPQLKAFRKVHARSAFAPC